MLTFLFLLLSGLAFGGDTTPPPVSEESIESNIIEDARPVDGKLMVLALWCQPVGTGELATKIGYLDPKFEEETAAFVASIGPRTDVAMIVTMNNPTAKEIADWLASQKKNIEGEKYRQVIISISCAAIGGDTDEERLLTREVTNEEVGGLPFADLALGIHAIAESSVWLLDTNRDLSAATRSPMFGPTADDVAKYGLKDMFAVSSSTSGKYGNAGLLTTAANIIASTNGGPLTLDAFYYSGVKLMAASTLDLGTSLGTPGDWWTGSPERKVLPGGQPIAQIAEVTQSVTKKKFDFRPSYGVIAGGGASLIVSTIFAIQAGGRHATLVDFNEFGGMTQTELDHEVRAYRLNTGLATGLGTLGVLATAGGVTWTVIDKNETTITLVPTGTGVMVAGGWQ